MSFVFHAEAETLHGLRAKVLGAFGVNEIQTVDVEVPAIEEPKTKRTRASKVNAEPQAATPATTAPVVSADAISPAAQSAPEGSAPTPQATGKIPSYDEVRAAGARYLEKTGETAASCPKFLELLISFGVDRVSAIPENRRAEFIARCDA